MGDNRASSSSRGGRGAGAETLVADHGRRRSSCGYCRSTTPTSISHGLWAYRITADDYQELLDRGWRRSGCFMYKPEMEKTCCPSYTIRLKAGDYVPSKEQVRVNKKMQRFLDGTISIRKPDQLKDKPNSPDGLSNRTGNSSSSSVNQSSGGACEKVYLGDEIIRYLSIKINDAVNTCVEIGELPSTVRLPDAVVKRVYPQAKRKLMENSEDLLYTSSISFQIVAVLRRSLSPEENSAPRTLLEISPNTVAEKLASYMVQNEEPSGMLIRACNGHLNFYSTTKQAGSPIEFTDTCIQTSMVDRPESKQSSTTLSNEILPCKRRKLEIRMKRSSFDPEEFALFRRYQIKVHDDKPEKVTESSYRRFLVDTPIIFVPPRNGDKTIPPCGFGSFHQQYLIDGKLVAVGVVDVLPKCLSSKYLFWDPDFAFLSLGKHSALQEINWVKESQVHCPSLQYYYLGYYIHSCSKMRYKAAYRPSELLCPLRYEWVPFDVVRSLLDKRPYVVLSDSLTQKYRSSSPQNSTSSSERSGLPDNPDQKEASSDEDEEEDLDSEGFGTGVDSESGSESCSVLLSDDLTTADIGNIVIDLNGSRVKLKDLQQVFGPIPKRHFVDLEMQLRRYVRVVGKELANRMVYSLG